MSLLVWWRSRRWRRAADEAVSSVHLPQERARLTAEVVERVTLAEQRGAADGGDKSSAKIEAAVHGLLNDEVLRTSLALRYLQGLQDRIGFGDYEDAPALRAELMWVQDYLATRFRSPPLALAGSDAVDGSLGAVPPLGAVLAARVLSELHGSAIAA